MKLTNEEIVEALKDMALQYLSDVDGQVMTHDFMNAGQNCLDVLERLGEMKTDDGVYYVFTEKK